MNFGHVGQLLWDLVPFYRQLDNRMLAVLHRLSDISSSVMAFIIFLNHFIAGSLFHITHVSAMLSIIINCRSSTILGPILDSLQLISPISRYLALKAGLLASVSLQISQTWVVQELHIALPSSSKVLVCFDMAHCALHKFLTRL